MEVGCQLDGQCHSEILKPLEQRRQREQKRCLAHSLVGTPNYIAPEVLLRLGEHILVILERGRKILSPLVAVHVYDTVAGCTCAGCHYRLL